MTINLGDDLRLTVISVLGGVGGANNLFYAKYGGLGVATQGEIVTACGLYMANIYNEMQPDLNSSTNIGSVKVAVRDTVTNQWIDQGSAALGIVGGSSSGMLPPKSPVRMTARTNNGKSPGKKRISGYDESTQSQGVLEGPELGRLALALVLWVLGFESLATGVILESGIFSEQDNIFKPFTGSGLVTNAFGTQDTRGLK